MLRGKVQKKTKKYFKQFTFDQKSVVCEEI